MVPISDARGRRREFRAGGHGRGLAPQPSNQWKVTAEMIRRANEKRAAATEAALAEGRITPDQVLELKEAFRSDPQLAVQVCALLGNEVANREVKEGPVGIQAATLAIQYHQGLGAFLENYSYAWPTEEIGLPADAFFHATNDILANRTEQMNG